MNPQSLASLALLPSKRFGKSQRIFCSAAAPRDTEVEHGEGKPRPNNLSPKTPSTSARSSGSPEGSFGTPMPWNELGDLSHVEVGDLDSLTLYLLNTRGWKPTLSRPTEFRRPKKQFEVPTWNCKGTKQISQVKTLKDYLLGNQEYFRKVLHIVAGDFSGLWAAMLRFHPGQGAKELIPTSRDSSPSPTSHRSEHCLSSYYEQDAANPSHNSVGGHPKRKRSASSELRPFSSKAVRPNDGAEDAATAAMQALMALASVASEAEVPEDKNDGHDDEAHIEKEEYATPEEALACKEEALEEDSKSPHAMERQTSEASEEPATTGEQVVGGQGVESQRSVASTCRGEQGQPPSGEASKLDDFQQKFVLTLRRALANKKAERAHVVARLSELRRMHSAAVEFMQGLRFPEDRELEVAMRMVVQRKLEEYASRQKECQAALHEIELWADTWLRSAEGPCPAASMTRLYEP